MKFVNFMVYSETEVFMGPNLNVIIGPNGSGKSTLGKISFLFDQVKIYLHCRMALNLIVSHVSYLHAYLV